MKAAREYGRDWRKPRGHKSGLCCPEATGWADTSPLSFQLQSCMSCSWQADCIPPTERKAVRMFAMHAASPPLPLRAAFRSLAERTFSAEQILRRSIETMMQKQVNVKALSYIIAEGDPYAGGNHKTRIHVGCRHGWHSCCCSSDRLLCRQWKRKVSRAECRHRT